MLFFSKNNFRVCIHRVDTARPCGNNFNAENIVYIGFNILISRSGRPWKLRELVPSFHSSDKVDYNEPCVFILSKKKSIIPDKVHLFLFCCFPVLFFFFRKMTPPYVTITSEQKIRRFFIFPKICYMIYNITIAL